jgi:hypothetical protein
MEFSDLIGEEGVKVDITANLAPETYAKIFATIAGAVIVSTMAVKLIGMAFKK